MLLGTYKHSIDDKNRIFIPIKFRQGLGQHCVLSRDIVSNCLNLYSVEAWKEYAAELEKLPKIEMQDVRQFVFSNSETVDLDSQGRIILNQRICADVGLVNVKDVVSTGNNTHVQIWCVSEWESHNEAMNSRVNRNALIEGLKSRGF